jgi:hypothetical protein
MSEGESAAAKGVASNEAGMALLAMVLGRGAATSCGGEKQPGRQGAAAPAAAPSPAAPRGGRQQAVVVAQ